MFTVPRHLSLVPASPLGLAINKAIAEVEKRQQGNALLGIYPYAAAFIRHYCETKTISAKHLQRVVPEYTPGDRTGPAAAEYLKSLDVLIRSRGELCPLPLSESTGTTFFPNILRRKVERMHKSCELKVAKDLNRTARERAFRQRQYENLLKRAEIELAFRTPFTMHGWYSYWTDFDIAEQDLSHLVFDWLNRFVAWKYIDRSEWSGVPFWQVMYEISEIAREQNDMMKYTDLMALNNRLTASQ